ncbi:hypothetical protein BH23ACT10_BH23ACT10_21640 [soil metagenome]
MALLLDSGVVYAYYDADDDWHDRVRSLLDGESGPLIVPAVVIPEVDHLLGVRIGHRAQLALYDDLVAGIYLTVDLEAERYARVAELNRRTRTSRSGSSTARWRRCPSSSVSGDSRPWTGVTFRRSPTMSSWSSCRTRRARVRRSPDLRSRRCGLIGVASDNGDLLLGGEINRVGQGDRQVDGVQRP